MGDPITIRLIASPTNTRWDRLEKNLISYYKIDFKPNVGDPTSTRN